MDLTQYDPMTTPETIPAKPCPLSPVAGQPLDSRNQKALGSTGPDGEESTEWRLLQGLGLWSTKLPLLTPNLPYRSAGFVPGCYASCQILANLPGKAVDKGPGT